MPKKASAPKKAQQQAQEAEPEGEAQPETDEAAECNDSDSSSTHKPAAADAAARGRASAAMLKIDKLNHKSELDVFLNTISTVITTNGVNLLEAESATLKIAYARINREASGLADFAARLDVILMTTEEGDSEKEEHLTFKLLKQQLLAAAYPAVMRDQLKQQLVTFAVQGQALSTARIGELLKLLKLLIFMDHISKGDAIETIRKVVRAGYPVLDGLWQMTDAGKDLKFAQVIRVFSTHALDRASASDTTPASHSFVAQHSAGAGAAAATTTSATCKRCHLQGHLAEHCKAPTCTNCDKIGHPRHACTQPQKQSQGRPGAGYAGGNKQGPANKKPWGKPRDNHAALSAASTSTDSSPDVNNVSDWCLDTGATHHMTGNSAILDSVKQLELSINVTVAGGGSLTATTSGTAQIRVQTGPDEFVVIQLDDVLHVPGLQHNLLSPKALAKAGHSWTIHVAAEPGASYVIIPASASSAGEQHVPLVEQAGLLIVCNKSSVYLMCQSKPSTTLKCAHQRLGHADYDTVRKAHQLADEPLGQRDQKFCEDCALTKSRMQSVAKKAAPRQTMAGELIHCDFVGPSEENAAISMEEGCMNGHRFAIAFIDDATKYTFLYLMTAKSEATKCLEQFVVDAQAKGITIAAGAILQSDNDRVLNCGRDFQALLHQLGMVPRTCPPNTPAMNGIVERAWLTLKNTARAMLQDAQLPKRMWGAAMLHAVYLRNRCPHSALGDVSPYFKVHGQHPKLDHLRKFGCKAYVHDSSSTRKTWDAKAKVGWLIGHSKLSTAYVIAFNGEDTAEGKYHTVEAMHVVFEEDGVLHFPAEISNADDPINLQPDSRLPLQAHVMESQRGEASVSQAPRLETPTAQQQHQSPDMRVPDAPSTPTSKRRVHFEVDNTTAPATTVTRAGRVVKPTSRVQQSAPTRRAQISSPTALVADAQVGHSLCNSMDSTEYVDCSGEADGEADVGGNADGSARESLPTQTERDTSNQTIMDTGPLTALPLDPKDKEPRSLAAAMKRTDASLYADAMEVELDSLTECQAYEVVRLADVPGGATMVRPMTNFTSKHDVDGKFIRKKARVVADGSQQQKGRDFQDSFAPVANAVVFRTMASMAAANDWPLHQIDIKTAFLNGCLEEDVYMVTPEGVDTHNEHGERVVWKLLKALYGLKQAPRAWYARLHNVLEKELGFTRTSSDACLYYNSTISCWLAFHVDDFAILARTLEGLLEAKAGLGEHFDVKDIGELRHFLGIAVERDHHAGTIKMHQRTYTEEILKRFKMLDAHPKPTPLPEKTILSPRQASEEPLCKEEHELYRELVGRVNHLAVMTRPDISVAISQLARFVADPTRRHTVAAKHLLRYLCGTTSLGLIYARTPTPLCCFDSQPGGMHSAFNAHPNQLQCFVDANWAPEGGEVKRKSTTGLVFMFNGAAIAWTSKLQPITALSSTEAEYIGLSEAGRQSLYHRNLHHEFSLTPDVEEPPLPIWEDNQSAIIISENPENTSRIRHLDVKFHFIRECVANKHTVLRYIPTSCQLADCLTKNLGRVLHSRLSNVLLGTANAEFSNVRLGTVNAS